MIISDTYPFGNSESFISQDISNSTLFEKLYIMPVGVYSGADIRGKNRQNEEHILLNLNRISLIDKAQALVGAFFDKRVWHEIKLLQSTSRFKISTLKNLLSVYCYGVIRSRKAIREILKLKLDLSDAIVESYWLHNTAFVAIEIGKKFNCPVVSRCHRCDVYENENENGYIPFREYYLKRLEKIFCISENAINYIASTYPEYRGKLTLSRLGTEDYGIEKWVSANEVRIVSCSYLNPVKRVHLIIAALKKIDGVNVSWKHFGGGALFKEIKNLAEKELAGKENIKVELCGDTDHSRLVDEYLQGSFDIFINVSESEGVPVSIMEALSYGIPVIATDVGGTSERVHTNLNGWLIRKEFKPEELSSLIIQYYDMNTTEKQNLRMKAREYWANDSYAKSLINNHEREMMKYVKSNSQQ